MNNKAHMDDIDVLVQKHVSNEIQISQTINSAINTIRETNQQTNAVIWLDEGYIEQEIERVEQQKASGKYFPLLGIPILGKETESAIEGVPNSFGIKELKDCGYKNNYTANSVKSLRDAGAIIIGKTNVPELALTVTTSSKAHGNCSVPTDLSRNAGGSSGGSASAVASGMTSVAMGTDGGGSIRIPAANCGVFGLKTSTGLISLGPAVEEMWAGLVSKGMLGNSVKNIASVLDAVSKHNKFSRCFKRDIPKLRIGIRTNGFADMYEVNPEIRQAVNSVAKYLESQGHIVENEYPVSYDDESIIQHFLNIIGYNSYMDIGYLRQMTNQAIDIEHCDPSTQYFYNEGAKLSEVKYHNALNAVQNFSNIHNSFFESYDLVLMPSTGEFAPLHFEVEKDPMNAPFIYAGLCFPINMSGCCSLSVPIKSHSDKNLACGVQIVSKPGNDDLVLQIGNIINSDFSDIFVTAS